MWGGVGWGWCFEVGGGGWVGGGGLVLRLAYTVFHFLLIFL